MLCLLCGGVTRLSLGAVPSGVLNRWLGLLLYVWYTELCPELGWVSRAHLMLVTGPAVCLRLFVLANLPPLGSSHAEFSLDLLFTVDVTITITATGRSTQL